MNREIAQRITKAVTESVPTAVIKRGNAFSAEIITDSDQLKSEVEKINFDHVTIESQNGLKFYGTASITLGYMDADCELTVELKNEDSIKVDQYEINLATEEIYLILA